MGGKERNISDESFSANQDWKQQSSAVSWRDTSRTITPCHKASWPLSESVQLSVLNI